MSDGHPNPKQHWKNRRRMAWICLFAGVCYPGLVLATNDPVIGTIAGPYLIFCGGVIAAYIGFASLEQRK